METTSTRPGGTVWVLTDRRYLEQRMPLALVRWLAERGRPHRVVVADEVLVALDHRHGAAAPDPWAELGPGDTVVPRTRNRLGLALLRAAERTGVRVLPAWGAVARVRNKPRALQLLADAGVPLPRTFLADSPRLLRALPEDWFPLLLKPHLGDNGAGIAVVGTREELDDLEWTDGIVLAQQYVDAGGVDLKLYVAGDRVWAVRKPSPLSRGRRDGAQPATAAAEVCASSPVRRLALRCGAALDLPLYGVDVLESDEGPLVVDVNEFPNYTGVEAAAEAIGRLVLARDGVEVAA